MNLKTRVTTAGKVATLHLSGSVAGNLEAAELREQIGAVAADGVSSVVLDCTDLTFISSLGLGIVIASLTFLRNRGGDLCLACVNANVMTVLEVSLLTRVIKMYDTTDEAVASFSSHDS